MQAVINKSRLLVLLVLQFLVAVAIAGITSLSSMYDCPYCHVKVEVGVHVSLWPLLVQLLPSGVPRIASCLLFLLRELLYFFWRVSCVLTPLLVCEPSS